MAREGFPETLRLIYVDELINATSPTAAEANGGVDLTDIMTQDSLDTPLEGSTMDGSDTGSRYNKTGSGTYGGQPISAVFYRDGVEVNDVAWNALEFGTRGYWLVLRFAGEGTITNGTRVEIWPIDVITCAPLKAAKNEYQKVQVTCSVPEEPTLHGYIGGVASS